MGILKKYEMPVKGSSKAVKSSALWAITGNFLSAMNKNLKEHSARVAYYMYLLVSHTRMNPVLKRRMVFAAYFHDLGKFMKKSDQPVVDAYLFLKYESPLKGLSKMILYQNETFRRDTMDPMKIGGCLIHLCNRFDELYMESRDVAQSVRTLQKEAEVPDQFAEAARFVFSDVDIPYEINSMHYEQVLMDFISSLSFLNLHGEEFILMLSSLFEMYNDVTLIHSKMTAEIAWMLSVDLGIDEKRGYRIYAAALVHDLGKIYIPLSILDKPGKLTDEEYEIMKTHVVHTRELLEHYMDTDMVEIACRHHERLDGSGYPNHITSRDMTLDQEILQTADVISALVARRSYKEAFPVEKVIAILDDNRKKGFLSGDVVDAFIRNSGAILERSNQLYVDAAMLSQKMEEERKKGLGVAYALKD